MGIRNTLIGGGSNWVDGEILYAADQNNTFTEVIQRLQNTGSGHDHDGTDSKKAYGTHNSDVSSITGPYGLGSNSSWVTYRTYTLTMPNSGCLLQNVFAAGSLSAIDAGEVGGRLKITGISNGAPPAATTVYSTGQQVAGSTAIIPFIVSTNEMNNGQILPMAGSNGVVTIEFQGNNSSNDNVGSIYNVHIIAHWTDTAALTISGGRISES